MRRKPREHVPDKVQSWRVLGQRAGVEVLEPVTVNLDAGHLVTLPDVGPVDELVDCHRLLDRVGEGFDRFCCVMRGAEDAAVLLSFVAFFEEFVGGWLIAREDVVLEAIDRRGPLYLAGRTQDTQREHRLVRSLLAELREAAALPAPWTYEHASAVRKRARWFAEFLSDHAGREMNAIYPSARAWLSSSDRERIRDSFAALKSSFGQPRLEQLLHRANGLMNRWCPDSIARFP